MNVAISWSGGKESALACQYVLEQGHRVCRLLNLVSRQGDRCCFHGFPARLLTMQAGAMGIPLTQKPMSDPMDRYEEEFNEALEELKGEGIEGVAFGDIYLDEHREWVERVCADKGMIALEPLWDMEPMAVIGDFLHRGFRAIVVSSREELGSAFPGREVSLQLADELIARGMCPCGEHGEYHTLVVDGPAFSSSIRIIESETLFMEGFWKHWALDIRKFQSENKLTVI